MDTIIISLILGAVGGFFSSYLLEKGKNFATKEDISQITDAQAQVQSKYNEKLERVREEIDRNKAIVNAALSNFSQGHQIAQQRSVEAIDKLWQEIIHIHSKLGIPFAFFSVLQPSEYAMALNDPRWISILASDSGPNDLKNLLLDSYKRIAIYRPFLGEILWNRFQIYRAVLILITEDLIKARQTKTIQPWTENVTLFKFINSEYKNSLDEYKNLKPDQIHVLVELLEHEILQETNRILSGEISARSTIAQSKLIVDALKEHDPPISSILKS